jgi:hypothetical protein
MFGRAGLARDFGASMSFIPASRPFYARPAGGLLLSPPPPPPSHPAVILDNAIPVSSKHRYANMENS